MAKAKPTKRRVGRQAPAGVWSPKELLDAVRRPSREEKIRMLREVGIVHMGYLEPLEELPLVEGSEITVMVSVPAEEEAKAKPKPVIPTWNLGLGACPVTGEEAHDDGT